MNRLPYDVTIAWGKEPMARLAQGLVLCGAQMTDSYTPNRAPQPREWVYLRVQIPEGREEDFRRLVNPKELNPAPKADVGVTLPDDPYDMCEHMIGQIGSCARCEGT